MLYLYPAVDNKSLTAEAGSYNLLSGPGNERKYRNNFNRVKYNEDLNQNFQDFFTQEKSDVYIMDFTEAEQRRAILSGQLEQGQITQEAFIASVNALRVTDSAGRTWQPAPSPAGWLCWSGSAWQAATPPGFTGHTGPGGQPAHAKDFVEFKSRLMTVDEFKKMSKEVPLAKRPQKWWDLLSILGGCVAAALWLLYSGNPFGEGIDILTPLLMVGLPVFMIWFREDLDVALLPLQQYRKDVNKLLLVGIGMAFPFLTAFILFNFLGITEYALMQYNMIIGGLGAYAITRNPVISLPGTGSHQGSGKPPAVVTNAILAIVIAVICYFLVLPVRADDCSRAAGNAADCTRTSGPAEVISGTPPAVIAGLVNGKGVHDTLTSVGPGGGQPTSPASQSSTTAGQSGSAGQGAGGASQVPGSSTTTSVPADQAGTASQAAGQTPVSTGTVHTGSVTDQAGTASQAAGQTQTTSQAAAATTSQGPDSLPLTPDDVQNIKEAIEDTRREREIAAAAAAAAVATAAAAAQQVTAAATAVTTGIDPLTGKRILTPEQLARREQILKEMEKNSQEATEWSTYADRLGYAETGLTVVSKTADIAIDVGSVIAPGAGSTVKSVYSAVKTVATSTTESVLDGKGAWAGVVKGSEEALVDKAFDFVGGKVADWFGGKIPGFGKFEAPPGTELGNLSLSQIRDRLGGALVKPDTGDVIQDLRQIATQRLATGDAKEALANGAKNALQGQAQSFVIWDRVKKWTGWFE
jgi:hypothetical protein